MATDYLQQPTFYRAWRLAQHEELSEVALRRLSALRRFKRAMTGGLSSADAAEVVGYPRSTLYRWRRAYEKEGPQGLEDRSRRPRRMRKSTLHPEVARTVRKLRHRFPAWGKKKLCRLVQNAGYDVSESTVGRLLSAARARGLIEPCPRAHGRLGKPRRKPARPHAKRLRRGERLHAKRPGEAIQVDTMQDNNRFGKTFYHFNAVDVCSRWNVAHVATRATAKSATEFLDRLERDSPFPIEAIQVDGGSEFMAEFEAECAQRGIELHVLAPKSPKLNGRVERVNQTWQQEFYACYEIGDSLRSVRPKARAHQRIYNFDRPHESLGLLSPAEYLRQNFPDCAPQSHM